MDFVAGDKIYKIVKGVVDKSKVFEIDHVTEQHDGNWHDGYITTWIASLVGEEKLFMTAFKAWGSAPEIYAEKCKI
jgi:hypothetical protein